MDLIDSQEVAEIIGVELATVYQYKTRGNLPTPAFDGRSPLWDRKKIEKWQRERRRRHANKTRTA